MFEIISIKVLGVCLIELGFSYSKSLGLRVWLCLFTFTFDWVGYDYLRREAYDQGIQKMFRIHYHTFNPNWKYMQDRHLEFRFGKIKKYGE